ncbi:phosphoenolpyruvate synthase [Burkholderia sp. YI23]|nr:phosphoenolpyruvate synthase [Burkholderia sp. YI23]
MTVSCPILAPRAARGLIWISLHGLAAMSLASNIAQGSCRTSRLTHINDLPVLTLKLGRIDRQIVIVMIPFCRSIQEADRVLDTLAQNGLRRGERGLQVYVMCEIPPNVILARSFAARFDGFSIGSNDLTQLTLGVDRDSAELAALFDEQNAAVEWMIRSVIGAAHEAQAKVGLCGQAPSDHPEFADFLVDCGIDSISVSPDSFVAVKRRVAAAERRQDHERQHGAAVAW